MGGFVNIFSLGRDMFGNAGGHHYFIISDRGMIVASLNQIGIGSGLFNKRINRIKKRELCND